MADYYILGPGHKIISVGHLTWAEWFEGFPNRSVADEEIGNVRVSTVFLGLDHQFLSSGPPLIFETMVFGGKLDGELARYSTWAQAENGHKLMVKRVKDATTKKKKAPKQEIPL